MSAIGFEKDNENIVTLTIDMPGQSVNTMNSAFKEAFKATVDRLEAERDDIAGVIITSAKKSFFAGGDLNDLIAVRAGQAEEFFLRSLASKGNLRRLEKLGKPVVAAINGAALGGGWEICLASHARFCLADDNIALGLPEVTLGLLPGAGGVNRMTRLLGLQAALPYLMDGKQFTPASGLKAGLITGLALDRDDLLAQARAWVRANPAPRQPWDQDGYKVPGGKPNDAAQVAFVRGATGALMKKTKGCYPAPEAILAAAVDGLLVDIDTALRIEARYFTSLVIHPVAKNMIGTLFFQMNEIKAGKSRPQGVARASFSRIGVLGAGMMGAGIAYANAMRGLTTVLKDVSLEAAQKGKAYTEKLLAKRVEQGVIGAQQRDAILALIIPSAETADLAGCDLIIEAVFEQRELKAQLTREAEPQLAPNGIMASNTSTLPISGLANASARPENFIGLHFFSPVDKMPLVEIIKGKLTSPETVARAYDYVLQIGKTPIVVNDSRGFFTSRVFRTFRMEGLAMLAEGLDPALIENAGVQVGMPVGPLAVADEVSMKLGLSVMQQTRADFAQEGKAWVAHPGDAVMEKMVLELNRPGRAGGGGFYEYPLSGKKFLWLGLAEHYPVSGQAIPFIDMQERILFIQSVESVRCLEEGVLESARDANIGSIFGIGAPKWTGGTLQYINQYGVRKFAVRAAELAALYGRRFEPPALLLRHAENNAPFV